MLSSDLNGLHGRQSCCLHKSRESTALALRRSLLASCAFAARMSGCERQEKGKEHEASAKTAVIQQESWLVTLSREVQ